MASEIYKDCRKRPLPKLRTNHVEESDIPYNLSFTITEFTQKWPQIKTDLWEISVLAERLQGSSFKIILGLYQLFQKTQRLLEAYDFLGLYYYFINVYGELQKISVRKFIWEKVRLLTYPDWAPQLENLVLEIFNIDLNSIPDTTNLTIALASFRDVFESDANNVGDKIAKGLDRILVELDSMAEILQIETFLLGKFIQSMSRNVLSIG